MSGDPRGTYAWQNLRREMLRDATTCTVCRTWISDDLPRAHPHKATIDHRVPIAYRPDLAFDRTLLRPVCWSCNSRMGQRISAARARVRRRASRAW